MPRGDFIDVTLTSRRADAQPTRESASIEEVVHLAERLMASVPTGVLPDGHDLLGFGGSDIANLLEQLAEGE